MSSNTPGLSTQWQELLQASEFAAQRFADWREGGVLSAEQAEAIARDHRQVHETWLKAAQANEPLPDWASELLGGAVSTASSRAYRLWRFVGREVNRHAKAGLLSLSQTHACMAAVRERLSLIQRRMRQESPEVATAAAGQGGAGKTAAGPPPSILPQPDSAAPGRAKPPSRPRRSLLEMLLDPRSIQWLLALGGTLMVSGLVILLWVNEFLTPPLVAVILGIANAALLAVGFFVLRRTRFQTAGKAITLLACLVMPLNLWYYHANGLITIDGHLWVAALVISALYAAAAWALQDEMFVYVFVGGVTLTGLLILADLPPSPQRFWEIASPATLLVALGLLSIHAERAFPESEGPFGRKRFGLAFFWSGHVVMAAGLLLVLGAQIAGWWLYEPFFKQVYDTLHAQPSPILDELRWLALALVVAGTYAYIYSDIIVRRIGLYVHIAAFTLLWAEVLVVDMLELQLGVDAFLVLLALSSLAVNLMEYSATRGSRMTRAFPVLGLLLGLLPVLLALWTYFRALGLDMRGVWQEQPPSWRFVGGTLLTAISCRVGAFVYRHKRPRLSAFYFFATAAATLVAAVALLARLGQTTWAEHAPWLMLIPIVYTVAARFYRGHTPEQPLVWVSHAAAVTMLVSSLASALQGFTVVEGAGLNLALALFFAEAAAFYVLAVALHKLPFAVYLIALTACGSVWQLLSYAQVPGEYYTLVFAVVGVGLLLGYRFAIVDQLATGKIAEAAFQSANTLLSLALVGGALMGLSRLASHHVTWSLLGLCGLLSLFSLAAAGLVRAEHWRRWYVVTCIGQGLLLFLGIQVLGVLSAWQKLEVFSLGVGLMLLVVGHVGWYREQDRQSDLVSMSLLLGSLLSGLPLAIATFIDRYRGDFRGLLVLNELGFLAVSILLLATGLVFQLKSTTFCGAILTALYFLALLIYVPWSRLDTIAVAITVGGGLLFGTGLALSLYRDRLLTLPDRVRRRQGIFQVLNWR